MPRARAVWIAAVAVLTVNHGPALAQAPQGAGDAGRGRALFIGARRLANGGPPCGGCHAIGGASAPFAAAMGPELSSSFEGLPPEAVDGLLTDLPFPTMAPIYAGRALEPGERADLAAFFAQVAGKPAPSGGRVAAWAALLACAVLAALGRAARRCKGPTRAALVARPRRPAPAPPPAAGPPEPLAPASGALSSAVPRVP